MGKPRKLKSSIKALQDAVTSIRPAMGAPLCIQPAETHSFREPLNSVYYAPSSSSSSTTDPHPHQPPTDLSILPLPHGGEEEEEEAATRSTAASIITCSSCISSSSSSSSLVTAAAAAPEYESHKTAEEAFQIGTISSKRFFFSPCNTKSITGESEPKLGLTDETTGEKKAETEEEEEERLIRRESMIPMAMASKDPYGDFRRSMEEVVEAQGEASWDWSRLQELLHCYLRLNEKKTHKFVVLAFVDLLANLLSQGRHKGVVFSPSHPSPLPPHLHLSPPDLYSTTSIAL